MKVGSNYDDGSLVELSNNGSPVYEMCCSEALHGPCGAVVIGKVGKDWIDLTAKEGLMAFSGACNGFMPLEDQRNGFHDVCIPDQCSSVTPASKSDTCAATIWQFSNGRYHSVQNLSDNPPR
jgi:hypothetical protein